MTDFSKRGKKFWTTSRTASLQNDMSRYSTPTLEDAKLKVRDLKEAKASKEEIDAALAEMKRLKTVCGEVELSKSDRKKLEKAAKGK